MKAFTLDEFQKRYFKNAQELADAIGIDRNTVYRNKRKGEIVVGDKYKFTRYLPQDTIDNTEHQLEFDNL